MERGMTVFAIILIASLLATLHQSHSEILTTEEKAKDTGSKEGTTQTSVTWIGHATALVQLDGSCFLTDPIFNDRVVIIKRLIPPGLRLQDLPPIDFVLISHNHYDHLDVPTLKRLGWDTVIIVPEGLKAFLQKKGFRRVRELKWWESTSVDPLKITAVPSKHFSGRGLFDRNQTRWCSYLVEGSTTVYFAGDTGYFDGFKQIGQRFRIDIALIPIGAYNPRRFMKSKHVDPEEALQAFLDLGAKFVIPIHWGTFRLSLESIDEPPKRLRAAAMQNGVVNRVVILCQGERWVYPQNNKGENLKRLSPE